MMARPPHYRRNFAAFVGDYIGFALALTFASTTTVLPDLVGRLTDSEVIVGLLSTVSGGAWLVPQLIFAHLLTAKRRKKPYLILGAVIGRPQYLFYAIALGLGLGRHPALALLLLFGVQFVFYGSDALAAVAWFDLLGKAIPEARRGRMMGSGQLISGLLSIGAGVIIATLLSANGPAFPHNYAIILTLAGVFFMLSLLSCSLIVEPDEPVEEQRPAWRDYLPHLLDTLRHNPAFARLIVVRLLAGFDGLALGFYIIFATRELGLPPETVGLFTAVQTAGRIVASVGLGALNERFGSHRVVQVATGIGMTAPIVALVLLSTHAQPGTTTIVIYAWVFLASGVVVNAAMLGFFNYVLQLAPAGQRPTYIGLFNTISGVLVVLPTIGGWLLRVSSYNALFTLTAAILVVAHGLSWGLPSARRVTTRLQKEPVT
jgi:MFS family permease